MINLPQIIRDSGGATKVARDSGLSLRTVQYILSGKEPKWGNAIQLLESCDYRIDIKKGAESEVDPEISIGKIQRLGNSEIRMIKITGTKPEPCDCGSFDFYLKDGNIYCLEDETINNELLEFVPKNIL